MKKFMKDVGRGFAVSICVSLLTGGAKLVVDKLPILVIFTTKEKN